MPTRLETVRRIKRNLAPGTPQAPTYFDLVVRARQACAQEPSRAAAARYGQLVSRGWEAWLIGVLTDFAVHRPELATRERVRSWQKQTLGHALASSMLQRWARPGAGDRGGDAFVDSARSQAAAGLFEEYRSEMKKRMARAS